MELFLYLIFFAGILSAIVVFVLFIIGKKAVHYCKKNNIFFRNHHSIQGTKDEFLSFATHQLQSPLTSIKWGLETLEKTTSGESDIALVKKLRTITDNMIATVGDLLNISKIEQGRVEINKEPIDLLVFISEQVDNFSDQAKNKKISLYFDTQLESALFLGDVTKLRQVINNIIDNAIKYTEHGGIIVHLGKNIEKNIYTITVTDTGAGIAREEIETLFEKFIRGSAGKTRVGGSGLGLYLSKKIIEMHNGTIRATSEGVGKGSTVIITLPDTHTPIA
jgi:signal transduction histidine kinase